jgi:hypothetical protein
MVRDIRTAMIRRAFVGLILVACGASDASRKGGGATLEESCRIQLAPRGSDRIPASAAIAPAPAPPRSSRLVTHVELKLAALAKELETKVTPRLAEERNRSIGVAGHLNYTLDRGPFTVAVEGDALVVRTDVRSRAEACRGSSCYASCEPQGRATATVPLRLTPEYRFAPSRVAFSFTRGCEVRALGGMLKIDVTPTIQAQLAPALRRVEEEINGKLPQLRPQAERLWSELGKTRSLPLGGCMMTNAFGIVEGPVTGTPETIRVRFGLLAHPQIRSRCSETSSAPSVAPAKPLPPLGQDLALPSEDDLVLTLVSALEVTASGLEGTSPFAIPGGRARIARAVAIPSVVGGAAPRAPALARLDLGVRGDLCGDVLVESVLAWGEDGRSLRLAAPVLAPGERERAAAASLDAERVMRSLATVRFPPSLPPETLKELVPSLASAMSDPSVEVSAKVSAVKVHDVVVRGDDVEASVLVRGNVELKQR